ncbi:uncharacterized protein LOC119729831 [Patiria miniata]|uniref:G-protein coupled receptors family 1 profile domain-containing protein n=1 Tax=Patiria miniata TaxID=46514 RepID=A0A914A3Y1_PATMI|nr:uncharacterized protein LOC119729831 [Patiria miniata]
MTNCNASSCLIFGTANSSIDESPPFLDDERHIIVIVAQTSTMVIILLLSVVGNSLVLTAIYRDIKLRNTASVYVANLATADLLNGLLTMPLIVACSVLGEWPFGPALCSLSGALTTLFCSVSVFTLGTIAVDRYIAIVHPLRYSTLMTRRKIVASICVTWLQAVILSALPMLGWSSYLYIDKEYLCTADWGGVLSYTLTAFAIDLGFPLTTMFFCYYHILKSARKQSRQVAALRVGLNHDAQNRSSPQRGTSQQPSKRAKSDMKAAMTLLAVIGTFLLCWLPHVVTMVCLGRPYNCNIPDALFVISTWLAIGNSACNPVIYGILNRQFRQAFREILCGWKASRRMFFRDKALGHRLQVLKVDSTCVIRTTMSQLGSSNITLLVPGGTDTGIAAAIVAYSTFILVLGVPGNSLILRVYWSKRHKSSTHILIMALAATDLLVCLLRPYEITRFTLALAGVSVPEGLDDRWNCFENMCVGTSGFITAVIAVDRYDCVCRPHRRLLTKGRIKVALLAAVASAVAANVPLCVQVVMGPEAPASLYIIVTAFQMGGFVPALALIFVCYAKVLLRIRKHVRVGTRSLGRALGMRHQTDAARSTTIATVSAHVGSRHCNNHTSCSDLGSVCNNSLKTPDDFLKSIVSQWSSSSKLSTENKNRYPDLGNSPHSSTQTTTNDRSARSATSSTRPPRVPTSERRQASSMAFQRKTTTMLFVVTLVFVILWIPYWIALVFDIVGADRPFVLNAFVFALYLNSAINPVIYGLANRRFRKDCKAILCRMR